VQSVVDAFAISCDVAECSIIESTDLVIEQKVGAVYRMSGVEGKFRSVRYPDIGHTYTPEMRREMLAWFETWLH
jgi:hypothetical protein